MLEWMGKSPFYFPPSQSGGASNDNSSDVSSSSQPSVKQSDSDSGKLVISTILVGLISGPVFLGIILIANNTMNTGTGIALGILCVSAESLALNSWLRRGGNFKFFSVAISLLVIGLLSLMATYFVWLMIECSQRTCWT